MKPKIDLKDPKVITIKKHIENETVLALEAEQTVESAIIPVYAIPKVKAHQKPKSKFEQVGSGVLVNIDTEYFLFTATHVALEFLDHGLAIGWGVGEPIRQYKTERFSWGRQEKPLENFLDASVFHIQEDLPSHLRTLAITVDDMDFSPYGSVSSVFTVSGFRVRKSNTSGNSVFSRREAFASVEYNKDIYDRLKISYDTHIVLAFEKQILVADYWQEAPLIRGMSGGALIRAMGTNVDFTKKPNKYRSVRQLLTGIVIEQHPSKNNLPAYILGTRIEVFLELVTKYLPSLEEKIW
ncbi:MAG: hypothetical protein EOO42_06485 [Flavobacteriales bacterium]|nr:MAG: hypothetical protein EOO42_06485 [Flavobacteriales bacterium]